MSSDLVRAYQFFTNDMWNQVIYSDKCKFELYRKEKCDARRPANTRYKNRFTKNHEIWWYFTDVLGVIKSDGTKILLKYPPECLNSIEYQSILSDGLLKIYKQSNIFMQDGASCHKSKLKMAYFNKRICDWSGHSPNINIIENLKTIIKKSNHE